MGRTACCSGWLPVQTVIFLFSYHVSKDRKNLLRVATHSGRGQHHSGGLTEYAENCLSARCSGWLPVQTVIFLYSSYVRKNRKNLLRIATLSGRGENRCHTDQIYPANIPAVRPWFRTDRNTVQNTGHCIRKRCGQRPGAVTTAGGRRPAGHICRHIRCVLSA